MKTKIEITYKGVRFFVIPPFSVIFHDMNPEAMGKEIEKGLQIIAVYILSEVANIKEGFAYDYILKNNENSVLLQDHVEYVSGKYTIVQNFTNKEGNFVLQLSLPFFILEKSVAINSDEIREDSELNKNRVLKEINTFFNLLSSYKRGDAYLASFYDYSKGYKWDINSEECPGSVSYKKL